MAGGPDSWLLPVCEGWNKKLDIARPLSKRLDKAPAVYVPKPGRVKPGITIQEDTMTYLDYEMEKVYRRLGKHWHTGLSEAFYDPCAVCSLYD